MDCYCRITVFQQCANIKEAKKNKTWRHTELNYLVDCAFFLFELFLQHAYSVRSLRQFLGHLYIHI